MPDVKFGQFLVPSTIAEAQAAAQKAEAQGFYSVSHNDHFYSPLGNPESPQLECFTVLTAVGAVTKTIKLVPAVAAHSFRTPPFLAKVTTSVDIATQGRFICGLGAGWQDKEYEAHGYPFPPLKQRLEELDETIQILKAMWTEDEPAFSGKYFTVHHAYNNPRPIQKPHPPIMLGGSGTGLLRLAARHADGDDVQDERLLTHGGRADEELFFGALERGEDGRELPGVGPRRGPGRSRTPRSGAHSRRRRGAGG